MLKAYNSLLHIPNTVRETRHYPFFIDEETGPLPRASKKGKVDNIQAGELTEGIWRRVALGHGLKLLTKNGHVYKYDGFRESVRCPGAITSTLWCHLV